MDSYYETTLQLVAELGKFAKDLGGGMYPATATLGTKLLEKARTMSALIDETRELKNKLVVEKTEMAEEITRLKAKIRGLEEAAREEKPTQDKLRRERDSARELNQTLLANAKKMIEEGLALGFERVLKTMGADKEQLAPRDARGVLRQDTEVEALPQEGDQGDEIDEANEGINDMGEEDGRAAGLGGVSITPQSIPRTRKTGKTVRFASGTGLGSPTPSGTQVRRKVAATDAVMEGQFSSQDIGVDGDDEDDEADAEAVQYAEGSNSSAKRRRLAQATPTAKTPTSRVIVVGHLGDDKTLSNSGLDDKTLGHIRKHATVTNRKASMTKNTQGATHCFGSQAMDKKSAASVGWVDKSRPCPACEGKRTCFYFVDLDRIRVFD